MSILYRYNVEDLNALDQVIAQMYGVYCVVYKVCPKCCKESTFLRYTKEDADLMYSQTDICKDCAWDAWDSELQEFVPPIPDY